MSSNIASLIPLLADFAGLHADTADRFACRLREVGLLPPEREPLEPLHAARLLVAIMAAGSPLSAVETVRRYEALPAVSAERRNAVAGALAIGFIPIEDLPIAPGFGPGRNRLTRSFVGALALCLEEVPADESTVSGLLASIGVSRTPWDPQGFIEVTVQPGMWARAIYARRSEQLDAEVDYRARTMTTAPGRIIVALGQMLRPAPAQDIEFAGPLPADLPGGR